MAEALAAVHGAVALLHQAQAKLGVLGDAPGRPAAQLLHQVAAHQGHGAVLDDGVVLVAQAHADVEEAGIFPVQHLLEAVALPVAMVLRRLDVGDLAVVEVRHQRLQPVRPHHVVAVDDADDPGVGRGLGQHVVQRAGLEALHDVEVEEAEALAELGAVVLHRTPHRGVLGVVVDDDDFEVRVVELGQRIEGLDHHRRRLVADREMQRDLRPDAVGGLAGDHLGRRQRLALPASAPDRLGHLQRLDERHGEAQHQEGGEHGPAHHLGGHHVAAGRDRRRHRPARSPTARPGRRSPPALPCRASGQRHRKNSITGSDSASDQAAAAHHCGKRSTGPVQENLGWRSAFHRPQ